MEQMKTFLVEHWPTIFEYALMFVAYFLVFLYRSKVNNTKQNLSTLFKERVSYIDETDKVLRADMREKLTCAESKYIEAVNKIDSLERTLTKTCEALDIMLNEEVEYETDETDFAEFEQDGTHEE